MPLDYEGYVRRLNDCDQKLDAIFKPKPPIVPESEAKPAKELQVVIDQEALSSIIISHIKEVKAYFRFSYEKATKKETIDNIIKSYEKFIEQLKGVNSTGKITKDVSDSIDARFDSRRIAILAFDLKKACELMFWASAAISLYAAVFLVALPMLIVQPTLGLAVSITVGGLFYNAAAHAIQCLSEFRSSTRHDKMRHNEYSLFQHWQSQEDAKEYEAAEPGTCC